MSQKNSTVFILFVSRQSYYNKRGFFGPPRMRSVVTYVIGLRGTCTCTSTPYSL